MVSGWRSSAGLVGWITTVLVVSPVWGVVASDAHLQSVRRIWNSAPHNAFTDLTVFNGQLYATFREASQHGVPAMGQQGGDIRVIRSADGVGWQSAASIDFGVNNDLRDPKLSVMPDGRLMLLGIAQPHQAGAQRQSYTWFSSDGTTWGAANPIVEKPRWVWRAEWHNGTAYAISYTNNSTRLHASTNGTSFTNRVTTLTAGNEAGLLFRKSDGAAVALVRREGADAVVGVATGNYTNWTWRETTRFVGGPDIVELPDGRIVAGGRFTDGVTRTGLAFLDPATGALDESLTLPSGGDTGYPGMVWDGGKLWVSYYSSHEGKASIYLAAVTFDNVPEVGVGGVIVVAIGFGMGRWRGGP